MWSASGGHRPDRSPLESAGRAGHGWRNRQHQCFPESVGADDPDTQYPLVIDPGIDLSSTYDTWVNAGSTSFSGGTARPIQSSLIATQPAHSSTGTTRRSSVPTSPRRP